MSFPSFGLKIYGKISLEIRVKEYIEISILKRRYPMNLRGLTRKLGTRLPVNARTISSKENHILQLPVYYIRKY
jgi:hypothetical protein